VVGGKSIMAGEETCVTPLQQCLVCALMHKFCLWPH
jgi:hypothetical protein